MESIKQNMFLVKHLRRLRLLGAGGDAVVAADAVISGWI